MANVKFAFFLRFDNFRCFFYYFIHFARICKWFVLFVNAGCVFYALFWCRFVYHSCVVFFCCATIGKFHAYFRCLSFGDIFSFSDCSTVFFSMCPSLRVLFWACGTTKPEKNNTPNSPCLLSLMRFIVKFAVIEFALNRFWISIYNSEHQPVAGCECVQLV